jgi:hypothetical protein
VVSLHRARQRGGQPQHPVHLPAERPVTDVRLELVRDPRRRQQRPRQIDRRAGMGDLVRRRGRPRRVAEQRGGLAAAVSRDPRQVGPAEVPQHNRRR